MSPENINVSTYTERKLTNRDLELWSRQGFHEVKGKTHIAVGARASLSSHYPHGLKKLKGRKANK